MDNSSAFPHPVPVGSWGDPSCGMSLLDWFAGQALSGLLASEMNVPTTQFASSAYNFAEKMLAEREKRSVK